MTATRTRALAWTGGGMVVAVLVVASVLFGVAELDRAMLVESRIPRTVALLLTGASLAVAGLIMQLLTRNVFVEPSTAGTMEFAGLGLVVVMLTAPGAPMLARMAVATGFALFGTVVFLRLIAVVRLRDVLIIPLIGIMLGGIVAAAATFIAYRSDLLQSLNAWTTGEFSAVLRGRYELLWLAAAATVVAVVVADRFTVAGMGEAFTTNLGLDYRRTLALGMTVVSVVSAVIVVTVGMLPFLGLVVPNLVRMVIGDNARRCVAWVALTGAAFVLACDLVARLLVFPFELPIGIVIGVLGAATFVYLLLGRKVARGY